MSIHEPTPMFETYNPAVLFELDYGLILKEQDEVEKRKATDAIPRTVAHYVSPQSNDVAFSKEAVADNMKSFGMDVIPIFGEDFGNDLGLILEHASEVDSDRLEGLIEDMEVCLHQLGWNYDGWICEEIEDEEIIIH